MPPLDDEDKEAADGAIVGPSRSRKKLASALADRGALFFAADEALLPLPLNAVLVGGLGGAFAKGTQPRFWSGRVTTRVNAQCDDWHFPPWLNGFEQCKLAWHWFEKEVSHPASRP
jgi:hypothetical protein